MKVTFTGGTLLVVDLGASAHEVLVEQVLHHGWRVFARCAAFAAAGSRREGRSGAAERAAGASSGAGADCGAPGARWAAEVACIGLGLRLRLSLLECRELFGRNGDRVVASELSASGAGWFSFR